MGSGFVAPKLLFCCFCMVEACYGAVLFSSLPRALLVSASPKPGQVLRAGEDSITVTWSLNQSLASAANIESFRNVKVLLCYAPISQVDRPWRKTVDKLSKDRTCQFPIFRWSYDASMRTESVKWLIQRDIPGATYFIRAYAYDSNGQEVAFGQTSDARKSRNLFEIQAITGTHWQLEVASICGSVFPLVSLVVILLLETQIRKGVSTS